MLLSLFLAYCLQKYYNKDFRESNYICRGEMYKNQMLASARLLHPHVHVSLIHFLVIHYLQGYSNTMLLFLLMFMYG